MRIRSSSQPPLLLSRQAIALCLSAFCSFAFQLARAVTTCPPQNHTALFIPGPSLEEEKAFVKEFYAGPMCGEYISYALRALQMLKDDPQALGLIYYRDGYGIEQVMRYLIKHVPEFQGINTKRLRAGYLTRKTTDLAGLKHQEKEDYFAYLDSLGLLAAKRVIAFDTGYLGTISRTLTHVRFSYLAHQRDHHPTRLVSEFYRIYGAQDAARLADIVRYIEHTYSGAPDFVGTFKQQVLRPKSENERVRALMEYYGEYAEERNGPWLQDFMFYRGYTGDKNSSQEQAILRDGRSGHIATLPEQDVIQFEQDKSGAWQRRADFKPHFWGLQSLESRMNGFQDPVSKIVRRNGILGPDSGRTTDQRRIALNGAAMDGLLGCVKNAVSSKTLHNYGPQAHSQINHDFVDFLERANRTRPELLLSLVNGYSNTQ